MNNLAVDEQKKNMLRSITCMFMLFWLILPVMMTVYCFIMGLTGGFVPQEKLSDAWAYLKTLDFYRNAFMLLGIMTIACVITLFVWLHHNGFYLQLTKSSPWFFLLLTLLAWAALSTALSNDPIEQLIGSEIICDGLFTYFVYAAVYLIGCMVTDETYRRRIILLYTWVISYLSVIMLLQETRNDFIIYCFPTIRSAVFQNSNYFGYMLCMSVIALLGCYLYDEGTSKRNKVLYGSLFAFQLFTLLLNRTFGSYLAVLFALPVAYLFYFWSRRKWKRELWIPIIIFLVLSVWYFNFCSSDFSVLSQDVTNIIADTETASRAGSGRWALWLDAVERIKAKPLLGWGPEGFNDKGTFATSGSPHNDILQIAGYLGVPAVLLYYGALIALAVQLYRHIKELRSSTLIVSGMVVCYLVSAQFGHPVYNTTPYFWLFLGMISAENHRGNLLQKVSEAEKQKKRRNTKRIVAGTIIFLVMCIGISAYRQSGNLEKNREQADLLAMYNAELTARLWMKGEQLDAEAYWYDVNGFKLVPIGDESLEAYGEGTKKIGDAKAQFEKEYDVWYQYDESQDYTDKIIKVFIDQNTQNISVEWVIPETIGRQGS